MTTQSTQSPPYCSPYRAPYCRLRVRAPRRHRPCCPPCRLPASVEASRGAVWDAARPVFRDRYV
jgi:hypothetical protein